MEQKVVLITGGSSGIGKSIGTFEAPVKAYQNHNH